MPKTNGYISLMEMSKNCNYSQEYLSLKARQGKLKAVKFGRNWVIKEEWLEEYLKTNSKAQIVSNYPKPKFNLLDLRYGLRYGLALTLIFFSLSFLLSVSLVFGKDALQLTKDTFQVISKEIKNNKIGNSIHQISLPSIEIHPIKEFKDTISFVSKIEFPKPEFPEIEVPKIEIPKIEIPKIAMPDWRLRVDKISYLIGKRIVETKENTFLFLAESQDNLKESIGIFQKFGGWYKEQVSVLAKMIKEIPSTIGGKIVKSGIALKTGFQNANDFVREKFSGLFKKPEKIVEEKLIPEAERINALEEDIIGDVQQRFEEFRSETGIGQEGKGVVVVPLAEKSEKEKTIEKLKKSFSDEVKIEPDETGVSGVIKPIFQEPSEQEYLYLMVPVKD